VTLPGYKIDGLTQRAIDAKDAFIRGLVAHGPDYPVKSKKIEDALHLTGPEIRALVSYLRVQGEPIGSDNRGYYWCRDAADLEKTKQHIQARIQRLQHVNIGLATAQANLRCGQALQGKLL